MESLAQISDVGWSMCPKPRSQYLPISLFHSHGVIPEKCYVDTICFILWSHQRVIILPVQLYFSSFRFQNPEQAVKYLAHHSSSVVSGSGPCPQWVTYQCFLFISLLLSPFLHWGITLTTPSIHLVDAYHKATVDISFFPATSCATTIPFLIFLTKLHPPCKDNLKSQTLCESFLNPLQVSIYPFLLLSNLKTFIICTIVHIKL